MDARRIIAAVNGDLDLFDLTVAERIAFAREIERVEVRRPVARPETTVRFTVPEAIERFYRGCSS